MKKSNLTSLKQQYEKLRKKYKLPKFELLNNKFGIEALAEHETEMLPTLIRHRIHERIDTFLRLMERLIVPRDSIMFMHAVKQLDKNDHKLIVELIEQLSKIEFESLVLETSTCNEKQEIKFIIEAYNKWDDIKQKINSLMKKINSRLGKDKEKFTKYFG
jgi:hypothetical protein